MMILRTAAILALVLAISGFPAPAQERPEEPLQVITLGPKMIIVSDGSMGEQLAVNSKSGIVVFDTLWCNKVARRFRERIEREFGRTDFAAVVLTNQRLDFVGGNSVYQGTEIIADEANVATLLVTSGPWTMGEIKARRRYMGELWQAVEAAAIKGLDLAQMQQELTIDNRFPFIKELPVWKNQGADWVNSEHKDNVARFWGQTQKFAAREIMQVCHESGAAAAIQKYRELQGMKEGDPIFEAISLDSLVEKLFGDGFQDAAATIAGLNAVNFPGSWRVHDRLGQLHLMNGKTAEALAAYRKSLELNPKNENTRKMIEKLGDK